MANPNTGDITMPHETIQERIARAHDEAVRDYIARPAHAQTIGAGAAFTLAILGIAIGVLFPHSAIVTGAVIAIGFTAVLVATPAIAKRLFASRRS